MSKKYQHIKTPKEAWNTASRLRKVRRLPELENLILQDASAAYNYALKIIKGRWPEAEPIILSKGSPRTLFFYAKNLIKSRWPEAEPKILKSDYIFEYASQVIKDRWPEAEKIILEKGRQELVGQTYFWGSDLMKYLSSIVKDRWVEAEEILAENPCALKEYAKEILQDKLPEKLHNIMLANSLASEKTSNCARDYFEFVKENDRLIKKILKNRNLGDMTVKDFIKTL